MLVMPRESGASSNHGPKAYSKTREAGVYWIARFRGR
jgi:hypothetical protein